MKLYRFSPIKSEKDLMKAIKYISIQSTKLCKKTIGKELKISYLTVFSHYEKEYNSLENILNKIGKYYNENNGLRVTLNKPIKVGKNVITHLRVRKPDPYRKQVGCSDFDVNYNEFKAKYLGVKNLRLIERSDYEMIEFHDPGFYVLAYAVSKPV